MLYDTIIKSLIDIKKAIKEKFGDDGNNKRGNRDFSSGPFGFDRIQYELRRIAAAIQHTESGETTLTDAAASDALPPTTKTGFAALFQTVRNFLKYVKENALFKSATAGFVKNDGAIGYPVKTEVGLGNVDNTSDEDKPVSLAARTALDGKLDIYTDYTPDDWERFASESDGGGHWHYSQSPKALNFIGANKQSAATDPMVEIYSIDGGGSGGVISGGTRKGTRLMMVGDPTTDSKLVYTKGQTAATWSNNDEVITHREVPIIYRDKRGSGNTDNGTLITLGAIPNRSRVVVNMNLSEAAYSTSSSINHSMVSLQFVIDSTGAVTNQTMIQLTPIPYKIGVFKRNGLWCLFVTKIDILGDIIAHITGAVWENTPNGPGVCNNFTPSVVSSEYPPETMALFDNKLSLAGDYTAAYMYGQIPGTTPVNFVGVSIGLTPGQSQQIAGRISVVDYNNSKQMEFNYWTYFYSSSQSYGYGTGKAIVNDLANPSMFFYIDRNNNNMQTLYIPLNYSGSRYNITATCSVSRLWPYNAEYYNPTYRFESVAPNPTAAADKCTPFTIGLK